MKNMMTLVLMGAIASCLCAQPTTSLTLINPGSMLCSGNLQHDDQWTAVNGSGDVQVGQKITCKIPITSFDEYIVIVKVFEPLTTIMNGQRVFTININGESKTIDIARIAGNRQMMDVSFVVAAEKTLTITFEASVRTALFSNIVYARTYHNILPIQIQPTAIMQQSTGGPLPLGVKEKLTPTK